MGRVVFLSGASCLLKWGELSSGASCLGASFMWGELSLGRVVCNSQLDCTDKIKQLMHF